MLERRSILCCAGMLIAWMMSAGVRAEPVTIPAGDVALTSELLTPPGPGPFPAVIALHGCGGLYTKSGTRLTARHRDWSERLVAAGFAVLLLDSFTARGLTQICTGDHRPVTPALRADDVRHALAWIATQQRFDPKRIVLLGWSHGAMTVLWTLRPGFLDAGIKPVTAFAFYPGCREIARQADWRPSLPLTVLIGGADDWTQPAPCRDLAARTGFKYIEYPGAYHDFDAPGMPVHVRKRLSAVRSGEAHLGTDPAARAAAITEVMTTLERIKTSKAQ